MIERVAAFSARLSAALDPGLPVDTKDYIVEKLTSDWGRGTRDNYLQKFEVFLGFLEDN